MLIIIFNLSWFKVETIIRQLTAAGDHERISNIIDTLENDFAKSPLANHRKVEVIPLFVNYINILQL